MPYSSKVRLAALILMCLLPCTSCTYMRSPFGKKPETVQANHDAPADPAKQNPEWAYDAPQYMKPAAELEPESAARTTDPLHYFTRERVVSIRRPGNYTPEDAPRVAIYWTDNNGFQWNKAGYFGREQSFFPLHVEQDGDYGIRFVGPGQEPAKDAPAIPERVYHVDTIPPEVEVGIQPEQTWYTPGQNITITWHAKDYHLIERPVSVFVLVDFTASTPRPIELRRDLPDEGTLSYEIPADMLDHELRIRVEALDRASNLGDGISYALQIVNDIPYEDEHKDEIAKSNDDENISAETKSTPVAVNAPVSANIETKSAPLYSVATNASANKYMPSILQEEMIDDEKSDSDSTDEIASTPVAKVAVNSSVSTTDTSHFESLTKKTARTYSGSKDSTPALASLTRNTIDAPATAMPVTDQPLDTMPVSSASISYEYTPSAKTDFSNDSIVESIVPMPAPAADTDADDEPAVATESSTSDIDASSEGPALDPLVMPLPATMSQTETDSRWSIAHPWRLLGNIVVSSKSIWVLPPMSSDAAERISDQSDSSTLQSQATHDDNDTNTLVGVPDEIPEPPIAHK